MGGMIQSRSAYFPDYFSPQEQEAYVDVTFLTKNEITTAFQRFVEMDKSVLEDRNAVITKEKIMKLPELKENPFKERICKVFSTNGTGDMKFDDFLEMISVFSGRASFDIKMKYAFQIYDDDDDMVLSRADIAKVIQSISDLNEEEIEILVDRVLDETEQDDEEGLSFLEFAYHIANSSDFKNCR